MKLSLDVIQWTDQHLDKAIAHDLSDLQISTFLWIMGNYCAKTGVIHKFRASTAAAALGCAICSIHTSITKLNEAGLTDIVLYRKKFRGRIIGLPLVRLREKTEGNYPLRVGKIHREALKALLPKIHGRGTVKMKLLLITGLHCDEETGQLAELRPQEWGEKIGNKNRVAITRAFDLFNEAGIMQTETDYTVEGRLPFTALACNFFKIDKAAKKFHKEESAIRNFTQYCKTMLYKYFAIDATNWAKEQLQKAYTELIMPITSGDIKTSPLRH